jgi:hypothetical protein
VKNGDKVATALAELILELSVVSSRYPPQSNSEPPRWVEIGPVPVQVTSIEKGVVNAPGGPPQVPVASVMVVWSAAALVVKVKSDGARS